MPHSTTSPSFCVYKITCAFNGKLYIGITVRGIQKRWKQHVSDTKRHPRLAIHHAIQKYGIENFTIELLEECPDHPTLLERERHWIAYYNTVTPNGYNTTGGGEGFYGVHLSEAHRKKISLANTGRSVTPEFCEKMHQIAQIRANDPEYREKLRKANTGKSLPESAKARIRKARGKQVFTPEMIEKRMQKIRGMKHTEQSIANMSKAQKGRTVSPEHRRKIAHTLQTITDEQAAIIKYDAYSLMQKEYATLFGLSIQSVNGIVRGRTYKHITREHLPLQIYKQQFLWDEGAS